MAKGMVSAPHRLAAQAGADVLAEGGSAIEAMIAAAAAIAVLYPHMNAIGGDGFWLIGLPKRPPIGIDASGPAARLADIGFYRDRGYDAIPPRGPHAALTVAGTVSGWQIAYDLASSLQRSLPVGELLSAAIGHARDGVAVTDNQAQVIAAKIDDLRDEPGFADAFLPGGCAPPAGTILRQEALAGTLDFLARDGLDQFYRGDVARSLAAQLEAIGSPLRLADLEDFRARLVAPLSLDHGSGRLYNMPPPSQGVASLAILGLYDRLADAPAESFEHVHGLVESVKRAFLLRNAHLTDPEYMAVDAASWLAPAFLDREARAIDMARAAPWPQAGPPGDTVWLGAIDAQGCAVSFIQSVFWEFGSGVVLPETGTIWQNRGAAFSLDANINGLKPGKRPFHTLNPALAELDDGRVMVYGNMGGEGQPQSQAQVFTRHVLYGQDIATAIDAPRFLLGKTWGSETHSLKLESRFDTALIDALVKAGHEVEVLGAYEQAMGHAGAVIRRADGAVDGASDPRCDGDAIAV